MKNFIQKIAAATILLLFLAFVFFGIKKLQPPVVKTSEIEKTEVPKVLPPQEKSEVKSVEIVFNYNKQEYKYPDQPILEIKKSENNLVSSSVRKELVSSLLEKLPDLAQPKTFENEVKPFSKKSSAYEFVSRENENFLIDKEATAIAIEKAVSEEPSKSTFNVTPVVKSANPEIGFEAERLKRGFKTDLSLFSTSHPEHADDTGRNINLAIAAAKIDGLVLKPGEEFNFDKIVGPRIKKNGFRMAGVISQGRLIQGLGGGICQVSTTVYRAALLANLKITERHNHSIYEGIPYADRGLDSAISMGSKNLRFINSLSTPILMSCTSGNGTVHIAFYGTHKPFDKVEVRTEKEVSHPFPIKTTRNPKEARPGVTGYTIESYRVVTSGDKEITEKLGQDHYLMFPQVVTASN
ncbi:MAG: VanW family protein [Candidatus Riflebacteria bacterium]|nr:VanW family protein [Candidatus Riflebacteria bacterium]